MTAASTELHWQSDDGLRLFARDYAALGAPRLPVVCIPGLTRNSADFADIAPFIAARGRRVLALDLRGRGRSERDPHAANYRPPVYAADVLALLRAQRIERAVFFGTSLGVLVTMAAASKRTTAVAAAILNDAGPEVPTAAIRRIRAYAGIPVAPMTAEATVDYVRRAAGSVYPRYADAEWRTLAQRLFRRRDDGTFELDYDPAIVRRVPLWLIAMLRPLGWRAFRQLARRRPTLLLRGARSDVLDAPLAARMVAAAPSMRLVEIPLVGHAPDLSEPESRQAIASFLDAVD